MTKNSQPWLFLLRLLLMNANVTAAQQCELHGYAASAFGNPLNQNILEASQLRLSYDSQQLEFK